jgi:hypothetical protein
MPSPPAPRWSVSSCRAILGSGNIGINTLAPGYTLDVNAPAHRFDNSPSWTMSSDVRLKQNIIPLTSALTRLLRLRGVTFEWKDPAKHGNLTGTQIGMIAQQVEEVFPEWVGTDTEGYKTLTYRGFEALTVESLRELQSENDRLKAENGKLAGKLASLEERLSALEAGGRPQHASMIGDGRWPLAVLLGASIGLAPWWVRRRRRPRT